MTLKIILSIIATVFLVISLPLTVNYFKHLLKNEKFKNKECRCYLIALAVATTSILLLLILWYDFLLSKLYTLFPVFLLLHLTFLIFIFYLTLILRLINYNLSKWKQHCPKNNPNKRKNELMYKIKNSYYKYAGMDSELICWNDINFQKRVLLAAYFISGLILLSTFTNLFLIWINNKPYAKQIGEFWIRELELYSKLFVFSILPITFNKLFSKFK